MRHTITLDDESKLIGPFEHQIAVSYGSGSQKSLILRTSIENMSIISTQIIVRNHGQDEPFKDLLAAIDKYNQLP